MADMVDSLARATAQPGTARDSRALFRLALGAIFILALAAASISSGGTAADEASAAAGAWFVADLQGSAFTRPGDAPAVQWRPLRKGMPIAAGSVLRTGADGRLVVANRRDRIRLAPNSELELPGEIEGDPVTRVIHWIGTVVFDIGKRPAPQFEVNTPYLVAIVKGTQFTTTVSDAGATIKVTEGLVGVSSARGGASVDLGAGQAANVSADDSGTVAPGELTDNPAPGTGPNPSGAGSADDLAGEADIEGGMTSSAGGEAGGRGQGGGNANAADRHGRDGGSRAGRGKGQGSGNGSGNGSGGSGPGWGWGWGWGWHGCQGAGGCHHDHHRPRHHRSRHHDGRRALVVDRLPLTA
jgi:hypothetical protein